MKVHEVYVQLDVKLKVHFIKARKREGPRSQVKVCVKAGVKRVITFGNLVKMFLNQELSSQEPMYYVCVVIGMELIAPKLTNLGVGGLSCE